MSKPTTPKAISKKKKAAKPTKESKSSPKHTGKIAKILSDMFSNKSAKFIKLHLLGLRTSEIASLMDAHPSFIHGVIARYKEKKK